MGRRVVNFFHNLIIHKYFNSLMPHISYLCNNKNGTEGEVNIPLLFKKFIIKKLLIVILLNNITLIYAQLDLKKKEVGIIFGSNFSQIQNAHNPSEPRYSFFSGLYIRIPIGILCNCDLPKIYLQPQLEYFQAGEKGQATTLYANNYLSFPLYLKLYPIRYNKFNYFFFQIGPRFSILVNQNVVDPPKGRPYLINQQGKANPFDLSVSTVGGVSFGSRKNELLLRYDYSFSNSYPNLNEYEATGDPKSKLRKIQHVFSIAYSRIIF